MYWIIYCNLRATSTEDLLRSVLLFWMVEPLSCRSFHKRDQEIFRIFLSSINIEHCPKYIKKTGTDHCWPLHSELQTEQPFAMSQSLNRLRRFPLHGPFARSRKHNCFWLISHVILAKAGDFFHPAPSHFPPLLFMFFWRRDPQCFEPNVIKYYHRINKSTLKNRFFSERLKLAQNTAKIDDDFLIYCTRNFDFGLR